MDLGVSSTTGIIAGGAAEFFIQFTPLFILLGGLLLVFGIISYTIGIIRGDDIMQDNDTD